MRYGQPYSSNIKTVSVGKSIEVPEEMFEGGSALLDEYPTIFLSKAMKLVNTYIERGKTDHVIKLLYVLT